MIHFYFCLFGQTILVSLVYIKHNNSGKKNPKLHNNEIKKNMNINFALNMFENAYMSDEANGSVPYLAIQNAWHEKKQCCITELLHKHSLTMIQGFAAVSLCSA